MPSTSPLTRVNYSSVVGYLLYPIIFSALELVGINTLPSNADTSERYQTLITPAGWAFAIWALIFVSELCYVVLQLHPRYRSHRMVRKGIHYWFFFVCMGQLFWSLSFGLNQIEMSTLFMTFILFCLVALEYCQYKTKSDGTKTEYWLLRFPFEVHTGWIVAAFAVNSNVAAAKWEASAPALFGLAVASIVYIIICAAFCLFLKKPNYAVPLTLAWATFGIAEELRSPMDSISRNFSEGQIASIRTTSAVVCALLITCTAFRGIWKIRHGDREHRGGSTTGVAQEESMMGITSDPQGGLR
mmetsp:Transcript_12438/g.35604  ORF Transcript_12438/g.35604 Transcript_12438/m.35604 type:complete len:300 (+) Transcript_12438:67-966(+)